MMTSFARTQLGSLVVIVVMCMCFGCASREKSSPTSVGASEVPGGEQTPTPAASERDVVTIALEWMAALRDRDVAKLAAQTAYPFSLHDTRTAGECTDALASAPSELDAALACLTTDELLQEDLNANPEPLAELLSVERLPEWTKPWRSEIAQGETAVSVFVPGNGSAFYFVVIVAGTDVRALWKHATFESN